MEGRPGCPTPAGSPLHPLLLGRVRRGFSAPLSHVFGVCAQQPYSPALLRGHFIKGTSPVMGIFSVLEAPDSPCLEPLPRQGVATRGQESLSFGGLRPGPREEARRLLGPLWAVPGWWWPAVGSSGPARSSRRCPSYAAAAAAEWSGNTGRSGWTARRCQTTSHLPRSEKRGHGQARGSLGLQWGRGGKACQLPKGPEQVRRRGHRNKDFPGGPVVKNLRSQCRGHEFDFWSGN